MNLNKTKAAIVIGALMITAGCAGKTPANKPDTNTVVPSRPISVTPGVPVSVAEQNLPKREDLKAAAPILPDGRLLSMRDEAFSAIDDRAVAMTKVSFSENGIAANGVGCKVDGNVLKIKEAGVYELSGTLSNGQIVVNAGEESTVCLILNGVNVHNENQSALVCKKTGKVIVTLAAGTENVFSDGTGYMFEDEETEPDATIFSKVDLIINGSGALTVNAAYKDAIKCKDALYMDGGVYRITAREDGIVGKDLLYVKSGDFTVTCEGDGLKSSNDTDEILGTVILEDGRFSIQAGKEAIQADNSLFVNGGKIVANGRKALLATKTVALNGGVLTLTSENDGVHSEDGIGITGGVFEISAGDDAIHAAGDLSIAGQTEIHIVESHEGLEGKTVLVEDGILDIRAEDDGINATGGEEAAKRFGHGEASLIAILGGYITVDADGDGVDSNSAITVEGGELLVFGPEASDESAIDDKYGFSLNGGTLLCLGSVEMAKAPLETSKQYSLSLGLDQKAQKDSTITVWLGEDVLYSLKAKKSFRHVLVSSPAMTSGSQIRVDIDGSTVYQGDLR